MTKKIIALTIAATAAFGVWMYYTLLCSEIALFERFPEIDSDVVIKAHRMMVKAVLSGEHNDVNMDDYDEMDELFMFYVNKI